MTDLKQMTHLTDFIMQFPFFFYLHGIFWTIDACSPKISQPMMAYRELDHWKQISVECESKYNIFAYPKMNLKFPSAKWRSFVNVLKTNLSHLV